MTSDDDLIAYLAGGDPGDLDEGERQGLDDLRALLRDRSVWAEPDEALEDAVVAAVAAERPSPAARPPASTRRLQRLVLGAVAAAALVVAVVLVTSQDSRSPQLTASLEPTEYAPAGAGRATFTETDAGWRIELDASGLPRLDDGRFYQAWLRNDAGDVVAVGTFNEPADVVLWAGVSPREFPTITVTEEALDGDPSPSGQRVLTGRITSP